MSTKRIARTARHLALLALALAFDRPLLAGGPTSHLAQASWAIKFIEDPALRDLLQEPLNFQAYLNGANFPDAFHIIQLPALTIDPGLSDHYHDGDSHSAHFLNTYAEFVRDDPGDELLLAHFLGTLSHIVADVRFDRHFVTRATRGCWPADFAQQSPVWHQDYTDGSLDWNLTPLRLNPLVSGIYTPATSFVPWEVGHLDPFGLAPSILETAFPHKTPISHVELSAGHHLLWDYYAVVEFHPDFYLASLLDYCDYAASTWEWGSGGAVDSATAIAAYIDVAWDALQNGKAPVFTKHGSWPGQDLDVAMGSAEGLPKANFVAWLTLPGAPLSVDWLELEDRRIAAVQLSPKQRVWTFEGDVTEVGGVWSLVYETTAGIADLAMDGARTGILLEDGQLLLDDGPGGDWLPALPGSVVSAFQLAGERTGALVGGELLLQESAEAPWSVVAGNVVDFRIEGNRVVVLGGGRPEGSGSTVRTLRVASQPFHGWRSLWTEVVPPGLESDLAFEVDGDRIAVLDDGKLYVAADEPSSVLGGEPALEEVAQFQMKRGTIAALHHDGRLAVQHGALTADWVVVAPDAVTFELEGGYVDLPEGWKYGWTEEYKLAFTRTDGTLWTNRQNTYVPPGEAYPLSTEHAPPVLEASMEHPRLEQTAPYPDPPGEWSKLEDRLAVVVNGFVYVQELNRDWPGKFQDMKLSSYVGYLGLAEVPLVQLEWYAPDAGPHDYVALFDHYPTDPNAYLDGQWQSADAASPWESSRLWAAGYYAAYVQEDEYGTRTIQHVTGPTQITGVTTYLEPEPGYVQDYYVELNWSVDVPGYWDKIALYDHDPSPAGHPDDVEGYVTYQWAWTVWNDGSPWVSWEPWAAGYYVAYIQKDVTGHEKILYASQEPTKITGVTAYLEPHTGVFGDHYVELNWSVDYPGNRDYVALYDHDPSPSGAPDDVDGYVTFQWAETGSPWVSWKEWQAGYYVAYVQEDAQGNRKILYASAAPTQIDVKDSDLDLSEYDGWLEDYIQMNWNVAHPGLNDYVALYNVTPIDPSGYLCKPTWPWTCQWKYAIQGSSWVTDYKWKPGYSMAYIQEDVHGERKIVAISLQSPY